MENSMTNERAKEILRLCSKEELKFVNTGFMHQRNVDYDEFAQQIVGETIAAILCTDTRDFTFTTYDKAVVDGIISKVVDTVRNHWNFK